MRITVEANILSSKGKAGFSMVLQFRASKEASIKMSLKVVELHLISLSLSLLPGWYTRIEASYQKWIALFGPQQSQSDASSIEVHKIAHYKKTN